MRCNEFDPEKFAQLLLIRSGKSFREVAQDPILRGIYKTTARTNEEAETDLRHDRERSEMDIAEMYLHYDGCQTCERTYQAYLSESEFSNEEVALLLKGLKKVSKNMQ